MAFVANVITFPWNPLAHHHFHHFPINCGIFEVAHHVTNPRLARRLPDLPQEFDPVFWFLGTGWYMIIYDKPCHSGHPITRPNMYVIIFDNHPCASNGQQDFLNTLALLCLSLAAGCPIPSQPTGTEPKLIHGIVCAKKHERRIVPSWKHWCTGQSFFGWLKHRNAAGAPAAFSRSFNRKSAIFWLVIREAYVFLFWASVLVKVVNPEIGIWMDIIWWHMMVLSAKYNSILG